MKKITIIEACSDLSLGGTQRAMQEFAIGLDKSKFKVIVCVLNDSGPRRAPLEKAGIQIVRIGKREDLAQVVSKYKADIVHAHSIRLSKHAGNAKYIKEVVFSSSYEPDACMNVIISKTLALKINMVENLQYGKNSQVIYYPQNVAAWDKLKVSNAKRAQLRKALGIKEDDIVLGRLGRAEPSKTDFLLLKSTPLIAKNIKNVKFVFVGLPLFFRKILAMHTSLNGKLIFLPETSDDTKIAELYQLIDVFWHTASRGETFGNVNTEAMIFEKPVLTHSTPFKGSGLKEIYDNAQLEIVDHMKTGIVASYPKDVYEAVDLLAKDRSLLQSLGKAGRKKVLKHYDSKVVLKEFERLAVGVMSGKSISCKPDKKEIDYYFKKEYWNRLHNQLSKSERLSKATYYVNKKVYSAVEYGYLVVRYLLREKARYNLEKKGYSNKPR